MRFFEGVIDSRIISGIAIVAGILGPTTLQASAVDRYSLKGVQLGITLDEFKAIPVPEDFSTASEEASLREFHGPPLQRRMEVNCRPAENTLRCEWVKIDKVRGRPEYPIQSYTPIGNRYGQIEFEFTGAADGQQRLARMQISMKMPSFEDMLAAYKEKFGAPREVTSPVQNGYGASFDQKIFTWSNGVSSIEMRTLCGSINDLCIVYRDPALEAAIDDLATKKAKAAASGL